jgi:ubiquitin carboxyl-terminal hydrolase 4/11/15
MKHDRDLELIIQWNSSPLANLKPLENPEFEQVNLSANSQIKLKNAGKGVSLYDCISYFSQEETLSGNDKWYCSRCKTHQNAFKKMEIYKCPEILIIHLKRFSHQRQTFFSSRKLSELVDFPTEGLDLSDYIVNQDDKRSAKYDLYAVSNHYGSLNGGHYTAFCKNPINKRWYEFDDSEVSKTDPSQSVTKAAYVLFYKRRQ